jgi:hypothetical protein
MMEGDIATNTDFRYGQNVVAWIPNGCSGTANGECAFHGYMGGHGAFVIDSSKCGTSSSVENNVYVFGSCDAEGFSSGCTGAFACSSGGPVNGCSYTSPWYLSPTSGGCHSQCFVGNAPPASPLSPPSSPSPPPQPAPGLPSGEEYCNYITGTTTLSEYVYCVDSLNVRTGATVIVSDNTVINATRIDLESGAFFHAGTQEEPLTNLTIYLRHEDCTLEWDTFTSDAEQFTEAQIESSQCLNDGQIYSLGTLKMFGIPKTPWTLLSLDTTLGDGSIRVEECEGWEVGDEISLAPFANADPTEEFSITTVNSATCVIGLSGTIGRSHRGSLTGPDRPMNTEVANLKRSVKIHGPAYPRYNITGRVRSGHQGIVTSQRQGGVFSLSYVAIEKCGRPLIGQYCLHWHHLDNCVECIMDGIVVRDGVSKGLTIHGTHSTTVENSVFFDIKGTYIYFENGQETNNTVRSNVLACPVYTGKGTGSSHCECQDCVASQRDGDSNEQSALYMYTASQHIVGNHIYNSDNCHFHNQGTSTGQDRAYDYVCPKMTQSLTFDDNVFHNCAGFGYYVNIGYPHKLDRVDTSVANTGGFVRDWSDCAPVSMVDGSDNGVPNIFNRHKEYNTGFGFGWYAHGDVVIRNSTLHNVYSKMWWRGRHTGPFCENCVMTGGGHAPGGNGLFEFRSTVFTTDTLRANHHCNTGALSLGSLCQSHYLFEDCIDIPEIIDEASDASTQTSILVTTDHKTAFLTGPYGAHVAFDDSTCTPSSIFSAASKECPKSYGLRQLIIWSADRGNITITVDSSSSYSIPFQDRDVGNDGFSNDAYGNELPTCTASSLSVCKNYMRAKGYVAIVKNWTTLTLNVSSLPPGTPLKDLFYIQYDHLGWEDVAHVFITVVGDPELQGGPCVFRTDHEREWLTTLGPIIPGSGRWYNMCAHKKWPVSFNASDISEFLYNKYYYPT